MTPFRRGPDRPMRVLDFDIENRPLAYLGEDYTTAEVTVIASCWASDVRTMQVLALGDMKMVDLLAAFRERYDGADLVTGHYIREHDLPILNGAFVEARLRPLGPKLTSDTKLDLVAMKYLSKSQDNLAHMLGLHSEKVNLSNAEWRSANRMEPPGILAAKLRCEGDVLQHIELRTALLQRGLIGPPVEWRP